MRIRWWPHTADPVVASTRLRCLQVIDALRRRGIDAGLYRPGAPPPDVLILAKRYDAASVQHATELANRAHTRLLLDICDNHFYSASDDPEWQIRRRDLIRAVATVDLVVASSNALAETIVDEAAPRPTIAVIGDIAEGPLHPSPVWSSPSALRGELELLALRRKLSSVNVPTANRMVWFGNHGSPNADGGMLDLLRVQTTLEELARDNTVSLTVISNNPEKFCALSQGWRLPLFYLPWRRGTFSRALRMHGVSIIPAGINPFTRCKTSNRVATSLVHGLAVIADPIPSYLEFKDCIFLNNWNQSLRDCINHHEELDRMVSSGRQLIEARYSTDAIATQWIDLLASPILARC